MTLTTHIAQLADDIASHLRASFPESVVPTVTTHAGDFDADAIERYARRANALILAPYGGKSERRGNMIHETIVFELFLLVKGQTVRSRERGVSIIYEHALKVLHAAAWDSAEFFKAPDSVQSKNLFGARVDEMGLALWLVRWDQLIQIPFLDGVSTLDDFARLYVDYVRPGETDPTNTIAEQQIDLPTV